eukprot:7984520-Pyramimonas_sp.AAC.1
MGEQTKRMVQRAGDIRPEQTRLEGGAMWDKDDERAGDIRPEQTRLEGGAMWDKDDEVRPLSDSSLFFDGSPPVPVTARTHTHHQTKWRCSPVPF